MVQRITKKSRGVSTIDALLAILVVIFISIFMQDYVQLQIAQANEFGIQAQLDAQARMIGSQVNGLCSGTGSGALNLPALELKTASGTGIILFWINVDNANSLLKLQAVDVSGNYEAYYPLISSGVSYSEISGEFSCSMMP
ncbi:MAG: hypothetical protein V1911_04095 [Candidatus Micrarchaeota archaeon]